MKSEPCVRFGIRINPKISEKPAESRNNRPPRLTLFTASTTHWLMGGAPARCAGLELHGRGVARVDRRRQIFLLVVGPELADVGVGLDDGVDELAVLALDLADEHVADDVAQVVEVEGAARRVSERHRAERVDQGL